jgi:hypothetical protein
MAIECAMWCCTSATMDVKTVRGRIEHEGLSFLTITLPQFGKDFEKSLDQGCVDRRLFSGFSRKAELPRFLGGFLDRVFDRDSGVLLDDPCEDAIRSIRQLTLMFGKIALPCSDARVEAALQGFIQCEQEVKAADARRTTQMMSDFTRISRMLFASTFNEVDREIYNGEVVPKHGPGVTADGLTGNGKYQQLTWTSRLERILPYGEMVLPNWSYYDQLERVDFLEPGAEIPVKVITVPKTLKSPRIIAVEPTAMQYAQQSILRSLRRSLDKNDYLSKIIGFDDQTPNQRLAQQGSLNGSLATLDLSEASDRVSNQLVRAMLAPHPYLHEGVDASRSRRANVRGKTLRLAKFASMGSALTFPMEAMVFTTLIFMGIERESSTSLCLADVKRLANEVRVYGDDLIVPVEYVHSVVRVLEDFGLRVNSGKSFWTGKFRESCGKEYYDGHDVSICRVRREFPTQPTQAQEVISTVELRNQLYRAGYWQTCKWLDEYIRGTIKFFPVVLSTSPVVGRESFLGFESRKLHTHLHSPLVKGYVVSTRIPRDPLEGAGALLKCFHRSNALDESANEITSHRLSHLDATPDVEHLERAGRPHAVNIKLRWSSAV